MTTDGKNASRASSGQKSGGYFDIMYVEYEPNISPKKTNEESFDRFHADYIFELPTTRKKKEKKGGEKKGKKSSLYVLSPVMKISILSFLLSWCTGCYA